MDGSTISIALELANRSFDEAGGFICVIHIIEWTDDDKDFFDSELTRKMELEDHRMLARLLLSRKLHYKRIVKIGHHSGRIRHCEEIGR